MCVFGAGAKFELPNNQGTFFLNMFSCRDKFIDTAINNEILLSNFDHLTFSTC